MHFLQELMTTYLTEQWKITLILFVLSFLINVFQTAGVSMTTARLIDAIETKAYSRAQPLYYTLVVLTFLFLFLYVLYKYFQSKLLTHLREWLKLKLMNIVLTVNQEEFSEINYSKLVSPINRVSNSAFYFLNDVITLYIPNMMFLFIVVCYFFYYDMGLGFIFLVVNGLIAMYMIWRVDHLIVSGRKAEDSIHTVEHTMIELLNNIDKVIFRGQSQHEMKQFEDINRQAREDAMSFQMLSLYETVIVILLVLVFIVLLLLYLIYGAIQGKFSAPVFVSFMTILLLYRDKVIGIVQNTPDIFEYYGRACSMMDAFEDILVRYDVQPHDTPRNYTPVQLDFHTVCFEKVTFKYKHSQRYVLNNFSLCLQTNNHRIIGLCGLSGNGKSTLAKLLLHMYRPLSGRITIDNVDIQTVSPDYLRKHIVYIGQHSKLFDKKIIDNMMYGCSDPVYCQTYLHEIMKFPKIADLYRHVNIHDQSAGALGENLSGGQRQVVNLISGLITPSTILILDEPTTGLDPALKMEVIGLIHNMRKIKSCILIITHDKDMYPIFDQRVVL